jgi:hypothetical protein
MATSEQATNGHDRKPHPLKGKKLPRALVKKMHKARMKALEERKKGILTPKVSDAIVYLRHGRRSIIRDMKDSKKTDFTDPELYLLLALKVLEGR